MVWTKCSGVEGCGPRTNRCMGSSSPTQHMKRPWGRRDLPGVQGTYLRYRGPAWGRRDLPGVGSPKSDANAGS